MRYEKYQNMFSFVVINKKRNKHSLLEAIWLIFFQNNKETTDELFTCK